MAKELFKLPPKSNPEPKVARLTSDDLIDSPSNPTVYIFLVLYWTPNMRTQNAHCHEMKITCFLFVTFQPSLSDSDDLDEMERLRKDHIEALTEIKRLQVSPPQQLQHRHMLERVTFIHVSLRLSVILFASALTLMLIHAKISVLTG